MSPRVVLWAVRKLTGPPPSADIEVMNGTPNRHTMKRQKQKVLVVRVRLPRGVQPKRARSALRLVLKSRPEAILRSAIDDCLLAA